jgi:ribonuclease HI
MSQNFESPVRPEIISERRNTIFATGYIPWKEKQTENVALNYMIYDGYEKLVRNDVLLCRGIESIYQLELWAIITALPYVTENVVMVKITQATLINGINTDLDFWISNNWTTKGGTPVKYYELWQVLYNERQRYQITAFQLEEQEARRLQTVSKARIYRNLGI